MPETRVSLKCPHGLSGRRVYNSNNVSRISSLASLLFTLLPRSYFFPLAPLLDFLLVRPHPDLERKDGRRVGTAHANPRRGGGCVGGGGAGTPPLRGSSRDVVGGAGLRPAPSGESERRADSTPLDREGMMRVLSSWRNSGALRGRGGPGATATADPQALPFCCLLFSPFLMGRDGRQARG